MQHFPNVFLEFKEAYLSGHRLWELGKLIHDDPKYAKPPDWILTYRYAVRAMLARIMTIDREYRGLNQLGGGWASDDMLTTQLARNVWNVRWESYSGVLFFAMDSSLECFAYALNALGGLLSPLEFLDITADEKLRRITPATLFDPPSKGNTAHSANAATLKWFPKICGHWSTNRPLLKQIIEYHDASKHRHSVVVGQGPDGHLLKMAPKQAMGNIIFAELTEGGDANGFVPHNHEYSLQSMIAAYATFMTDWLLVARQELQSRFGNLPMEL